MIVDAHVHLWDAQHTPQPWMTAGHAAIASPFGPDDLRPLLERNGVDAVVLVQGACLDSDMDYLLEEAARHDWIAAVNGFSRVLEELVVDLGALCERDEFPQRLMEFNRLYRNRAAHTDRLTLQECLDARRYLLEEPTELLVCSHASCDRIATRRSSSAAAGPLSRRLPTTGRPDCYRSRRRRYAR
jgi:hypothetical protein